MHMEWNSIIAKKNKKNGMDEDDTSMLNALAYFKEEIIAFGKLPGWVWLLHFIFCFLFGRARSKTTN